MNPIRSIRGLLLSAGLLFSVALFVLTVLVVTRMQDSSVRQEATQDAHAFAELTFNTMFELMSTGWSREQLMAFVATIQRTASLNKRSIDIHRGDKVESLFGTIEQAPADALVARAYQEGLAQVEDSADRIRVVHVLVAKPACLRCHDNASTGDVLGVIDVRQDIGGVMAAQRARFAWALAPMVPVALIVTLVMVVYIRRRLDRSIRTLASDIAAVNKLSDLRVLEARSHEVDFDEFGVIAAEVAHLTRRIRTIAVDKEMLQFEIRLLEKFIITSDVIKDWREYVKQLITDIDTVMPAYAMFSLFKVGEAEYDLQVFWRHRPSAYSKQVFEDSMRQVLQRGGQFDSGYAVRVEHNVVNGAGELPEFNPEQIEVQVKSLLVGVPKIGGIVGIGMQPQQDTDPIRLLVIESVLATLLNVVGSVKAIDRYTKDLEYYATRDPLTNLYNQRVFWELAESEVIRSTRHGHSFGMLVIDADNFKSVNDSFGHGTGDALLQQIVQAIRGAIRDDDMLARYGGDEFVVVLPETDAEATHVVARRVIEAVAAMAATAPNGERIGGSVSIGMACYPDHAITAKDLFLFADNMMYRAKADGKSRILVPQPQDVVEVFRTLGEKSMLILQAIERRDVVPVYQPIIDVHTGQVKALEVLSRIRTPNGDLIVADDYVSIAEKMGVMHKLDLIQLEKTLVAVAESGYPGMLFINLSPRALVLNDFVKEARRIVSGFRVDPTRVVFEITERETIKNLSLLDRFIGTLRAEGFKLAIDDFGSGFSSFHYVKRFPVDFLKIEGEFILGMPGSEKDRALVRSIVGLGQELGIQTVAEYVESEEILRLVKQQGIDMAQGYHVQRPNISMARAMMGLAPATV